MAEDPPSDAQQHLVEDITYGSNRVLSRTIRGNKFSALHLDGIGGRNVPSYVRTYGWCILDESLLTIHSTDASSLGFVLTNVMR